MALVADYSSDDAPPRPKRARLPPPPPEVFGAARDPEKPRWTRGFAHVPGNWPSYVYVRVARRALAARDRARGRARARAPARR